LIHRKTKLSDPLVVRSNDLNEANMHGNPTQRDRGAQTSPVVLDAGNVSQNCDGRSVQQTFPLQSPKVLAVEGIILTSGVNFTGAAVTIWSHFAQHGIAMASEAEAVGLAMLGFAAALSGMSFVTAMKMVTTGASK
jgi:hypothetical protein